MRRVRRAFQKKMYIGVNTLYCYNDEDRANLFYVIKLRLVLVYGFLQDIFSNLYLFLIYSDVLTI